MPTSGMIALARGNQKTLLADKAVASQATVYSPAFVIEDGVNFTLFMKCAGATPHLKVTRCYSPSIHTVDYEPEVDTWAELDLDGQEDVLVADFKATSWRVTPENPKYSVWIRYKITGLADNGADTTISMNMVKQRQGPIS